VVKNVQNFESLGATPEEREKRWRIGGLNVYTTMNLSLQTVAQDRVWELVPSDEEALELGGATTSVEVATGRVLAMAQNKIFNDSEEGGGITATAVNFNTDRAYGGSSGFQVGSTYKIFALIAWLQRGYGLNEVIDASRMELDSAAFLDTCGDGGGPWFGPWQFRNSGNLELPTATVFDATVRSINSAFASMAEQLDQCEIRLAAESLGVHRADRGILQTNPAAVLGTNELAPLTMATSFAGIAGGGVVCEPIIIDKFVTAEGTTIPGQEPNCRQGITPDVAAAAAAPMRSVITGGTGTASNPGGDVPVIGKTGTTDAQVQTWMVGASTKVATAVWVGNIKGDYRMARYRNGTVLRHGIWRVVMQTANEQYGGDAFPAAPERLVRGSGVSVPDITGLSVDEATIMLESIGLRLEALEGMGGQRISAFQPGAGTYLARGMIVRVSATGGGGGDSPRIDVVMPDLIGLSLAAAYQRLDSIGQTGWRKAECDPGSPGTDPNIGTVTSQNVNPGNTLPTFKGVRVGVACGAATPPEDDLNLG